MDIAEVDAHLVRGISYVSLVAPNINLFQAAICFYSNLSFRELHAFDQMVASTERNADICRNSEKETWLMANGTGMENVVVKIRLVHHARREAGSMFDPSIDCRGIQQSICFQTHDLTAITRKLASLNINFSLLPSPSSPCEMYLRDPLGNLIGFTAKDNPFSTMEKPASLSLDAPITPEIIAQNTCIRSKRIAVMTSGGDAPGMNAAVRAVVRTAVHKNCEPYAIYEGYEGLVQGGNMIRRIYWEDVRGWLSEGGTLIGTARCAKFREKTGRLSAAKNLIINGIDALIVCGGDGSLTGADLFRSEWPSLLKELVANGELRQDQIEPHMHLNIVGLVGSIDNDMSSTDATIGAFSSLTRICEAVDSIDATAFSHSRAFVIEVMGRHCGWLALMAGLSTGADYIFIPENPPSGENWEERMCENIAKHRKAGKRKTLIIVAEGAIDRNLQPITATFVKDLIVKCLGLDTRITTLGHTQRGGVPCAFDRVLASLQGAEAVEAALELTPDSPSVIIGVSENKITRIHLQEAVKLTQSVAASIQAKNFDSAMKLRDSEFSEYLDAFYATSIIEDTTKTLPKEKRLRVAIIHIGAPAGGINAATRAAASWCMTRGHTPLAIHNGFPGLVRHDAMRELEWLQIEGWAIRGGSEIGTNRDTPDIDMGMVAWSFQKHKIDALLLIGGFEAFHSLEQLYTGRKSYPAFRIPMVCLPATISNNVPGTEYSVGSDTCLNSLISYCDAIKQSANASRRRVFVVETQGGNSGYVATVAALATGALAVYTPEEGITLKMLEKDINHLRRTFATDQGKNREGKLILRNEKASKTFSTDIIANIFREEAKNRFEARTAIPGHFQQGGTPSPMDRVRATRLAVKCIHFLEKYGISGDSNNIPDTAAVIGIRDNTVVFTSIEKLSTEETDWKNRTPRHMHWQNVQRLVDILSGRLKE